MGADQFKLLYFFHCVAPVCAICEQNIQINFFAPLSALVLLKQTNKQKRGWFYLIVVTSLTELLLRNVKSVLPKPHLKCFTQLDKAWIKQAILLLGTAFLRILCNFLGKYMSYSMRHNSHVNAGIHKPPQGMRHPLWNSCLWQLTFETSCRFSPSTVACSLASTPRSPGNFLGSAAAFWTLCHSESMCSISKCCCTPQQPGCW